MAEDLPRSEAFGTVYRVTYADGFRAFFTEVGYQQEHRESQDPARLPEHRIVTADAFRDARFEAHYGGWWMLTGVNADGRRVDLADTTEPELETLTLPPTVARQLGFTEAPADRGDFDVHYGPETGTASIQAEYGDRPDLGDATAAEPVERSRLQELAARIRAWFHRDQDQGIGL